MKNLVLGIVIMGKKIGQGKVNASKFLRENVKIRDALVKEIRKAYIPSAKKTAKK